ncbi:hypothetical protein CYMTET_11765 [Cymbomonas tetramitiformis]|uniref:Uncharacterized protein n=1 Tax=Cymbomonas tetramitiformis TaxID=36881 RepID=A0AAE0GLY1_9CHLO|nr:hypothetical protein CYMTET_11765 [Cymbomonas tetramitiformis]
MEALASGAHGWMAVPDPIQTWLRQAELACRRILWGESGRTHSGGRQEEVAGGRRAGRGAGGEGFKWGEHGGRPSQLGESSAGSSEAGRLATNLLDSIQDILRGERPARRQSVVEEAGGGQEGPTGVAPEAVTQGTGTRRSQGDGDLVSTSAASQGASTHILSVDNILMEADNLLSPGSEREFLTQEQVADPGGRVAEGLEERAVQIRTGLAT